MTIKNIQIDERLHQQIKLAAILRGLTIRAWTEQALEAQLPEKARQLVDSRTLYETEEQPCSP